MMGSMVRTLANCTSGMYSAHTTWAQPGERSDEGHINVPYGLREHLQLLFYRVVQE